VPVVVVGGFDENGWPRGRYVPAEYSVPQKYKSALKKPDAKVSAGTHRPFLPMYINIYI
jgi:hypothetical protein